MKMQSAYLALGLIVLISINAIAQTDILNIRSEGNDLRGSFTSDGKRLFIESHATKNSLILRIKNHKGRLVAESNRDKDIVQVTISDVIMTFYIDKRPPENKRVEPLSEVDQKKLNKFRVSDESASLRKLIEEIIKQSDKVDPIHLKSFAVLSMILGEGPGNSENPMQGKASCTTPKRVQMFASYVPSQKANDKLMLFNTTDKSLEIDDDCKGCCGWGCAGCYGCWTSACWNHDHCVELYGYFSVHCVEPLALAIASVFLECAPVLP